MSDSLKTYPVNETFYTFQGEGLNSGKAAFFIRLHGCPVHCSWCDSAGTWHKDFIPKHIARLTIDDLMRQVKESGCSLVVITGGEPCIHDLDPLIVALSGARIDVTIETSGAFEGPKSKVSCLTVSPKWNKIPLQSTLKEAQEWKLIIESPESIPQWMKKLTEILGQDAYGFVSGDTKRTPIWLHPEWTQSKNSAVLNAITEAVKAHPKVFRAGWQLHKNYRADALDPRSQSPVPLGGKKENGY